MSKSLILSRCLQVIDSHICLVTRPSIQARIRSRQTNQFIRQAATKRRCVSTMRWVCAHTANISKFVCYLDILFQNFLCITHVQNVSRQNEFAPLHTWIFLHFFHLWWPFACFSWQTTKYWMNWFSPKIFQNRFDPAWPLVPLLWQNKLACEPKIFLQSILFFIDDPLTSLAWQTDLRFDTKIFQHCNDLWGRSGPYSRQT